MAPPKRKTGGRTTPKGTRPGERAGERPGERRPQHPDENADGVHESGRYTPPIPASMRESPRWVPALMLALLIGGAILIILRNLVFSGNNLLTIAGLGCILGGLYTATKWR